ncbi:MULTISPECIES: type II toxin-antitoxin system YhaV family toxin [Rahnella]|uniref:Type II toxin-antitoxin system YhaV family toxin n=1 Tax=Rahnella laticis TaxID=2787622 RepID=A0ABS0E6T4_9GAMM|nr:MULTISPECIES: type II toxin-antitoxin system YhaV family toxin [Rahnella]MBF7980816.1 type II toxin-antitoxin system YhaV family toxin [Rahnella laticis]MBF8000907.1 type II toxin-antitoxin system YhaV family toxin [Rahnella sp. LAC-M12]
MHNQAIEVNGWTLLSHPLIQQQIQKLTDQVIQLRRKDPVGYKTKNASKRLAAINKLMHEVIPQDPARVEFRQGDTLGGEFSHWFRAKFFQQYRLFFRYNLRTRIIIYAWVNDDKELRAYESKTDVYRVFRKMLKSGEPPDSWAALLEAANGEKMAEEII